MKPLAASGALAWLLSSALALAEPTAAPFGAGASVEVTSSKPAKVFVAALEGPDSPEPSEFDFKTVGATPLSFQLPPGSYWIDVEGHGVTRGALRLDMTEQPKSLQVSAGSAGLADAAALLMAVGVVGIVAGAALLAAGTKADSSFDKPAVVIPVFAVGGVALGAGVGCYFGSRTTVTDVTARR